MKRAVFGAWLGVCGVTAVPVLADQVGSTLGTVVELYTSQGCSSCPPADRYLEKLAAEPGVIALALHVDYWDYIGWADAFADPKFTARQKAYAHVAHSNMIYTPQMIVGGVDHVVGNDLAMIETALRRHQSVPPTVTLDLTRQGAEVVIAAQANPPLEAPVRVQLVRYQPMESVRIEAGENAGLKVDYANVVTAWSIIGMWDGKSDLRLTAPTPGKEAVVVILQADGPGKIFAAAQIK